MTVLQTEDAPMPDPIDLMKPWTIKSVPTRVITGVATAARRENLTVGQWLEKRFDEWEGRGSPERQAPVDLSGLLTAAAAFATVAKLPREVRSLIADTARNARGKPGLRPGITVQPPAPVER
jgi:hypothetical protein